MKILAISDLHLEFSPLKIPNTNKVDVVLLLGDVHTGVKGVQWAVENIESKHIIYILGNHEYYGGIYPDILNKIKAEADKYAPNFHILENGSVIIEDVTFFGATLWSDFALFGDSTVDKLLCRDGLNDYRAIKVQKALNYGYISPNDVENWHHESVNWLKNALKDPQTTEKRVICTHHAPSRKSIAPRYFSSPISAAYASNLDALVAYSGAKYWFHGHVHNSVDYTLGDTRVICNPRGYNDSNKEFNLNSILEM